MSIQFLYFIWWKIFVFLGNNLCIMHLLQYLKSNTQSKLFFFLDFPHHCWYHCHLPVAQVRNRVILVPPLYPSHLVHHPVFLTLFPNISWISFLTRLCVCFPITNWVPGAIMCHPYWSNSLSLISLVLSPQLFNLYPCKSECFFPFGVNQILYSLM